MLDEMYPQNSTYYTQILDSFLNTQAINGPARQRDDDLDSIAINLRPNEIKSPIEKLKNLIEGGTWNSRDIDDFSYPLGYTGISQNQVRLFIPGTSPENNTFGDLLSDSFAEDRLYFGTGDRLNEYRDLTEQLQFASDTSFEQNYKTMYKGLSDRSVHRKAVNIVCGGKAHSEVLAYKLVKHDAVTDEILQEFYFFNTRQVEDFRFIDSQVLPNKTYTYKIYTINFVVGSKYFYDVNDAMIKIKPQLETEEQDYNRQTLNLRKQ